MMAIGLADCDVSALEFAHNFIENLIFYSET